MKTSIMIAAAFLGLSLRAFAGTESAPAADGKDMKQVAPQIAPSDAGFYVAAYGGANFDTWYGDKRETISTAGGSTFSSHSDIADGWGGVGGIKIGYNFESCATGLGSLRLQPGVELEGLYIGDDPIVHGGLFGGTEHFDTNSADFFLNGILRFKNSSIVTPYIGLGVGGQYITTHGNLTFNTTGAGFQILAGPPGGRRFLTGLDTSDFDFAGQALFGLDVQICQHISLFTEYKFIDAIGTDAKNANVGTGVTYRFKPDQIEQNLITAGIKYTF